MTVLFMCAGTVEKVGLVLLEGEKTLMIRNRNKIMLKLAKGSWRRWQKSVRFSFRVLGLC